MEGGFFCKCDKDETHYNICKIKDPDFEAQDELKEMLYNAEGVIIAGKFNESRDLAKGKMGSDKTRKNP